MKISWALHVQCMEPFITNKLGKCFLSVINYGGVSFDLYLFNVMYFSKLSITCIHVLNCSLLGVLVKRGSAAHWRLALHTG